MSEIFKIQKNSNYTAMSNIHLQDKRLSLKAKGLLSLMLSLPVDRWKYSIRGLASICRDGVDSVRDGIRELERAGYVIRFRSRKANGQLGEAIYWIYEDYATQRGFTNIRHFTDDGYTGTNFNRPGFKAMMAEVEAGNIGVIIVKDMSRFGRDYLQVGYFTEMMFPEKGIRFIAVVNDVDSTKPSSGNDFIPFLNVMNEWYAKDTSRKIKAIFQSRMAKGERCTGSVPYGFILKKEDGVKALCIDEDAAKVVRSIFDMAADRKLNSKP